jgi:hypothetical protein
MRLASIVDGACDDLDVIDRGAIDAVAAFQGILVVRVGAGADHDGSCQGNRRGGGKGEKRPEKTMSVDHGATGHRYFAATQWIGICKAVVGQGPSSRIAPAAAPLPRIERLPLGVVHGHVEQGAQREHGGM